MYTSESHPKLSIIVFGFLFAKNYGSLGVFLVPACLLALRTPCPGRCRSTQPPPYFSAYAHAWCDLKYLYKVTYTSEGHPKFLF